MSNGKKNNSQVPVKELFYDSKQKLYLYPSEVNEADIINEILHFSIQVHNICNKYKWEIKEVSNKGRKYTMTNGIEVHYINFSGNPNIRREYNKLLSNNNPSNGKQIKELLKKNNQSKPDNLFDYQIAIRFVGLNDILDDDDTIDAQSDYDILINITKSTSPKNYSNNGANHHV